MSGSTVSAKVRQHAIDLVRCGATFKAAGAAVGLSDFPVRKWCRAAGVVSARSRRGVSVVVEEPSDDTAAAAEDASAPPGPDAPLLVPPAAKRSRRAKASEGRLAERKAELDAALAEVARLRDELRAITARMAAANRRAEAAEKRAAFAEQRLLASLFAHPR